MAWEASAYKGKRREPTKGKQEWLGRSFPHRACNTARKRMHCQEEWLTSRTTDSESDSESSMHDTRYARGEHLHTKALLCEVPGISSDRYNVCARESPWELPTCAGKGVGLFVL